MELTNLTIAEAAKGISSGEISPVELTRAHLERIAGLNPRLNCFLTVTAEPALQAAHEAQEEIQRGEHRGLLHGIPLALKDLYETQGILTTAGSKFFSSHVPRQDAHVVQLLHEAGSVLMGKLNMHEIALGVTNENPHFGDCKNPWKPGRISGGSSGGSAAALAANLCMGALGTDTGGSIRIPASLCGVVGLKPTYGRISLRGIIPLSWNLDHPGPMARTVRDVAILFQVIASYDPLDPASMDVSPEDCLGSLDKEVSGLKVAVAMDDFFRKADIDVLEAVDEAAGVFESLGCLVEELEFPQAHQAAQANGLVVTSDAAAFHRERLANQPTDFGDDVFQRLRSGAAYTSTEYILARRTQAVLRRQYEEFFNDYDFLLTPTTPIVAPAFGADAVERARLLTRFTAPFNLTGLPAISLPCGLSSEGLPIGLQIVAHPWDEARLLRVANQYQLSTSWHLKKTD